MSGRYGEDRFTNTEADAGEWERHRAEPEDDRPTLAELNAEEYSIGHGVGWSHFGWSCICGAGNQWPMVKSPVRGRTAAQAHMRGVERRR